jgi:hypothetical protein
MMQDRAKQEATTHVLEILQCLTADKDVNLSLGMTLSDTGLDSVCIAYLIGDLQQYYALNDSLFTAITAAQLPLMAMTVSRLIDFVEDALGSPSKTPRGCI